MLEQLRVLIELQCLVYKKSNLLRDREEAPQRIEELEREFSKFEQECLIKKAEYENALKMRRTLESDVKDLETRRARSKGRINEVKTNREYQALLKEIDDIKSDITSKEDRILEFMETIERLEDGVKDSAKELETRKKRLEEDKERLLAQSRQVDEEIQKLESLQQELRVRLEPEIMKRYEFLLEKRAGIAVAAVQSGVCQICHLNIPPQRFIELQRDEAILQCPHCQRYIYWAGDENYYVSIDELVGL